MKYSPGPYSGRQDITAVLEDPQAPAPLDHLAPSGDTVAEAEEAGAGSGHSTEAEGFEEGM